MTRFLDNLTQAVDALFDHKLRSALSVLGITIGIAAVMAVTTISKGGNHVIYSELQTFGLNSVWVYRNWNADTNGATRPQGPGINTNDYRDLSEQAESLGIRHISPVLQPDWRVQASQARRTLNVQLIGSNKDYPAIVNDSLTAGRWLNTFDIQDRKPAALLAPTVVERVLDPSREPVGQSFRMDGKRFTVVGVLALKSRDFLSSIGSAGGENANDRIIIPYTTLQDIRGDRNVDYLQFEVEEFDQAQRIADRVRQRLLQRHPEGFDYTTETMASHISTADNILGGVSIIGIVAASISLLVGGMGIMNMMGTSVIERTREIGVRKAIGATERDILYQFLLEAGLISIVGGLLGLIIGGVASVVLAVVTEFPIMPSASSIVGALLVSIVVGVLSGILPARRAAKMKPVDALNTQ